VAAKVKPKRRKAKAKQVPDLIRRQRALTATMEKFGGSELDFVNADCGKLARYHLAQMGHRGLPPVEGYSDAAGAKRHLKGLGFRNLEQLFDSLLPRIAPAYMLPGDIAVVQPEPGAPAWQVGTVVISVGRKFLGWHPDHPVLAVIEPALDEPFVAAWKA